MEPPGETFLTSGCGDFSDLHDVLTHATPGQVIYAHTTDLSDVHMQATTFSDETPAGMEFSEPRGD